MIVVSTASQFIFGCAGVLAGYGLSFLTISFIQRVWTGVQFSCSLIATAASTALVGAALHVMGY